MNYLQTLPYFKVFKRKSTIQIDPKSTSKNSLVFLCNKDTESSIKLMSNIHPMITDNNKFKSYYIDPIYKTAVFNKRQNVNFREGRKTLYEEVSDKTGVTPYATFGTINQKNVYVDLHMYNSIFFDNIKPVTLVKRITAYMNFLSDIIKSDKYREYKYKSMLIDAESWIGSVTTANIPLNKISNNPVMFFIYSIRKDPSLIQLLGDIDIYIYTSEMIIRINPTMVTDKVYAKFIPEMNKMFRTIDFDSDIEEEPQQIAQSSQNPRAEINKDKYTDTTVSDEDEEPDTSKIDDISYIDIKDEMDELTGDETEEEPVTDEEADDFSLGDDDEALVQAMSSVVNTRRETRSPESLARDKVLKEKQSSYKFENKPLSEYIKKEKTDDVIDVVDISAKVHTTNENAKTIKFVNYERAYNEKIMKKDTVRILGNLNGASIPAYIIDMKVEDSSDELNYKETYTVVLEDSNRVRHTLKFDMPKFIEDKFLYIGGNKKIISKQIFNKPIVKTGPDTVQICSNYNKIFIERYGAKMSPEIEKFKKAIGTTLYGVRVERGDSSKDNVGYVTTIDYDELAKSIYSIKTKNSEFIFNQRDISERYKAKSGEMCIGFYSDGKPILMNIESETVDGKSIVDFLVENISSSNSKFSELYDAVSSGTNRYMFSRATIMHKHVPIILLLGYCEGLSTVLRKAKVKYYFTDKRPSITDKQEKIQFADGYLVYDRYPFENSLLLNGLLSLPTKAFSYSDMDDVDVYVDMFDTVYNARNLANAFDSFYDFMIDPITKEILEDMKYPTDFVSVVLLASSMLADNSYTPETNMNSFRIRSNEVVNAILHKEIANAYFKYRMTANNKNPVKISIKRDAVIKELLTLSTVEDYSTLNPIYEVKKLRNASLKGFSGMNLDSAFTLDKRGYDKTMVGVFGISSSTDGNVGIIRQMALEPNIEGPRGYIKVEDNLDNVKDVNLFTPAELLTPMGVTRDDGPRVSMASVQSSHIVPIENSSPVLISNGIEQTIPYYLSSDFTIIAEDDGEIVEVNDKTGLIIGKYKNGKPFAIDVNSRMAKNSSSGFYVDNKLKCDLKVGDKFKKQDILAYENRFFTDDGLNGTRMNIGSFEKVAIMSSYATFEDACFITKKISDDMATSVIMMKDVVIGKNANVDSIVSVGDHVGVGDTLVSFETSYDDSSMNKFLASVGDELQEEIINLNKTPIKSKYAGDIVNIKIYSSVELDELSPSLKKIVSDYYTKINAKKRQLDKYDKNTSIVKCGMLFNETTGKISPGPDGKLKGHEVFDGVLIEFYIKYVDRLGVGDKLTYFSALKSIVSETIDEGFEPYSEFRPDEEVSTFVGPAAIIARMVPSTISTILGNKVIVELKRKLKDIYES